MANGVSLPGLRCVPSRAPRVTRAPQTPRITAPTTPRVPGVTGRPYGQIYSKRQESSVCLRQKAMRRPGETNPPAGTGHQAADQAPGPCTSRGCHLPRRRPDTGVPRSARDEDGGAAHRPGDHRRPPTTGGPQHRPRPAEAKAAGRPGPTGPSPPQQPTTALMVSPTPQTIFISTKVTLDATFDSGPRPGPATAWPPIEHATRIPTAHRPHDGTAGRTPLTLRCPQHGSPGSSHSVAAKRARHTRSPPAARPHHRARTSHPRCPQRGCSGPSHSVAAEQARRTRSHHHPVARRRHRRRTPGPPPVTSTWLFSPPGITFRFCRMSSDSENSYDWTSVGRRTQAFSKSFRTCRDELPDVSGTGAFTAPAACLP